LPELEELKADPTKTVVKNIAGTNFLISHSTASRLLFIKNNNQETKLLEKIANENVVIGYIKLDNYETTILKGNETEIFKVNIILGNQLTKWANNRGIFYRNFAKDQYLFVATNESLAVCEKNHFGFIENVYDEFKKQDLGITISIGVGKGTNNIIKLNELALEGLQKSQQPFRRSDVLFWREPGTQKQ